MSAQIGDCKGIPSKIPLVISCYFIILYNSDLGIVQMLPVWNISLHLA